MSALDDFRKNKDDYFRHAPDSPLPHGSRDVFPGLSYFPSNESLVFTLEVARGDAGEIEVETTDGRRRSYRRAGRVRFEVDGTPAELTLYDTGPHGWFLPYRDATSGTETYGAGRYLDLHPNEDGTVTIDFNYAYNPFCAYDDAYSCPLPPAENWLQVPIRAGEKLAVPTTPG